jgi:L-2,4-diaminobutyrate transaminase
VGSISAATSTTSSPIITIAKGMTSAYLLLSANIVNEKVWNVLADGTGKLGSFGDGWTYSAHSLRAAAANANPDIVDNEDLTRNARDRPISSVAPARSPGRPSMAG